MRLYLVQHAEAEDERADPCRPLTSRGRESARRAAALAARLDVVPVEIIHSGKPGARETAEILGWLLKSPVAQCRGLGPQDPIEPWLARLGRESGELMLVGHLPFLERLCSSLLTGDPERAVARFSTSEIVCLERGGDGCWRLLWALWPEMARPRRLAVAA